MPYPTNSERVEIVRTYPRCHYFNNSQLWLSKQKVFGCLD